MLNQRLTVCLFGLLGFSAYASPEKRFQLKTTCFQFAGQRVCEHDEGHPSGYFHTYDAIKLPGDVAEGRKVHIYLPRSYSNGNARYPVVYFNDGQSIFFPNNEVHKSWKAAEVLDALYAERAIPEVIIVAVYPNNRDAEYTHEPVFANGSCCGLPQYADFMATTMREYVDQNYRTKSDRENNFIIGSSHGGLAAFYIATKFTERFGGAGCLSSSFWVGMSPVGTETRLIHSSLIASVRSNLANEEQRPRLWLDWGLKRDGGFHNSFIEAQATIRGKEMVDLLESEFNYHDQAELVSFVDPVGEHSEDSWARRLPAILKFLLSK